MTRYATSKAAADAQAQFEAAFNAHVADSAANFAKLTEEPPFDPRKGTIRGFLAMCLVFLVLAAAWSALP